VWEDFIPILEGPSLFFYKQKQVFLYWPYSEIANAVFTIVKPSTLLMGFKSSEFDKSKTNLRHAILTQ